MLIRQATSVRTTWLFSLDSQQSTNIRPDYVIFSSGLPSESRSFKQFKLASVRMLFRVREYPSVPVNSSGQRGYTVRTPLSVRRAMGFLSKKKIWEDSCNRLEDADSHSDVLIHKARRAFKIMTFGRRSSWSERASFTYGNYVH
jgi:hypothetical protein